MKFIRHACSVALILHLLIISALPLLARSSEIETVNITLAVSPFQKSRFSGDILTNFQIDHPNVKVNLVELDDNPVAYLPAYDNLADFEAQFENVTKTADVILIDSWLRLPPEATVGKFFLDLKPLLSGDDDFTTNDYYQSALKYYQWDDGIWALPIDLTPILLTYNTVVFDQLGLSYPTPDWTIKDLEEVASKLTKRDNQGNVTRTALDTGVYGEFFLLRSLLGEKGLVDDTQVPNLPNIVGNDLFSNLLTRWFEMRKQGLITSGVADASIVEKSPMAVQPFLSKPVGSNFEHNAATILPGHKAGLDAQGLAISAGTRYPELAFTLIKYLTAQPDLYANISEVIPARKSLSEAGNSVFASPNLSSSTRDLLISAINNAMSIQDIRFFDYVFAEANKVFYGSEGFHIPDHLDVDNLLANGETNALKVIKSLSERAPNIQVINSPPLESPQDKPHLSFAVLSSPVLANRKAWEDAANKFVSQNPSISSIQLDADYPMNWSQASEKYDCYYMAYTPSLSPKEPFVLDLKPLIDADTATASIPHVILQIARQNDKIYGLPLTMTPNLIYIDKPKFEQMGIPLPTNDWTINDFIKILIDVQENQNTDSTSVFGFKNGRPSNLMLLQLMAALGGSPVNYTVQPLELNLTDAQIVQNIRQILDLARNGYIDYSTPLSQASAISIERRFPLFVNGERLLPFELGGIKSSDIGLLFPEGKSVPLTLGVGFGYVSTQSQYPEMCYQFLSSLLERPDLFGSFPFTMDSLIWLKDNNLLSTQQIEVAEALVARLNKPNLMIFPDILSDFRPLESYWIDEELNSVFDNYVLRNVDLERELADTQNRILSLQNCVAASESITVDTYEKCAVTVGINH